MAKHLETGMLRGRPFGGVMTLISILLLFTVMSVLLLLKCLIICSLMYTCPVLERQIARYYIKIYLQTFGHGAIVTTSVNVLLVEILTWTWIVMMTLFCVLEISSVTFHSHVAMICSRHKNVTHT